jgi:hypothetical protein
MYDVQKIRADFPILAREVNGKPLVYLDNGASAQKPQVVIDAVDARLFPGIRQRAPGSALPVQSCDRKVRIHPGQHCPLPECGFRGGDRLHHRHDRGDQPCVLRLGRTASATRGRDRAFGDGASRQYRALALPARTAGGGAEMGRGGREGRSGPAGGDRCHRAEDEAGGRDPYVERAWDRGRRHRDLPGCA